MRETFHKSERLCSKTLTGKLYETGSSFHVTPFRVRWMIVPRQGPSPARILIAVPKSCLRKASSRNLVKRRCREAYRREKHRFYKFLEAHGLSIVFSITWQGQEILPYPLLRGKIILLLHRLTDELEKASG